MPHVETLWTVNELGRVYRHKGDYGNTKSMHVRAVTALTLELPEDYLEVIWTLNTLAKVYIRQERHPEALPLHQRVLETRRKLLGHKHPHTLRVLGDVAKCHMASDNTQRLRSCIAWQCRAVSLRWDLSILTRSGQ